MDEQNEVVCKKLTIIPDDFGDVPLTIKGDAEVTGRVSVENITASKQIQANHGMIQNFVNNNHTCRNNLYVGTMEECSACVNRMRCHHNVKPMVSVSSDTKTIEINAAEVKINQLQPNGTLKEIWNMQKVSSYAKLNVSSNIFFQPTTQIVLLNVQKKASITLQNSNVDGNIVRLVIVENKNNDIVQIHFSSSLYQLSHNGDYLECMVVKSNDNFEWICIGYNST